MERVRKGLLIVLASLMSLHLWKTLPLQRSSNCEQKWKMAEDGQFTAVIRKSTYVFSAFLDQRQRETKVIFIAVSSTVRNVHIVCTFIGNSNTKMKAKVVFLNGGRFKYHSVMISCGVPQGFEFIHVGLSLMHQCPSFVWRPVQIASRPPAEKLGVCVHSPVRNHYPGPLKILEHIEMNRIFGAKVYMLYNQSADMEMGGVMDLYRQRGILTIKQWELPVDNIYHGGQVALINDCIYRFMFSVKYLVLIDLDEFVVPRNNNELLTMISNSNCSESDIIMARNVFFPVQSRRSMNVFSHFRRETEPWECPIRSKMIVKPDRLLFASVHTAVPLQPVTYSECCLNGEYGLLHHYRVMSPDILRRSARTLDLTMKVFEKEFHAKVNKILFQP